MKKFGSKANGGNKASAPKGKTDAKAKPFGEKMKHRSPGGSQKGTSSKAKTFGHLI